MWYEWPVANFPGACTLGAQGTPALTLAARTSNIPPVPETCVVAVAPAKLEMSHRRLCCTRCVGGYGHDGVHRSWMPNPQPVCWASHVFTKSHEGCAGRQRWRGVVVRPARLN